jgi:putative spermidine/putrescine transport system ATP-binding protein
MTQVSIQSLVKRYGASLAVDRLSLEVGHGEFISLLGPSGCGKTTTLKCIAGFEEVDGGAILFDGQDVSRRPPEERDIGMVFQSYALFPHMNVAQNLAFGLEMRKLPKRNIARRVDAALDLVQLTAFGGRYPRALSGGQQQRVALARALVIEPKILLLDEPLANLDAALRDEMRGFIRDIQKRVGITTLYVTHDQAEAMTMSDRVVVMFEGRVAQADIPARVYDNPASARVAQFVGQANILHGSLEGGFCALPPGVTGARRIMARPEAISLEAAGPKSTMTGRIAARYFHGAFVEYRLAVGETSITAHTAPPMRWDVGDMVALRFDEDRLWPLDDAA